MSSLEAANLFNVKGQVFVITGGGSGLGSMMAQALDINGASKVFILGRRLESLKTVAAKATNRSIVPVAADVTSKDSLAAAVAEIKAQTPFVNAVVANSGKAGPATHIGGPRPTTIAGLSEEILAFDDAASNSVFGLNFTGTFNTFASFLPLLDAGNVHPDSVGAAGFVQSQFITLGSIAGFSRDIVMDVPYSASKAAVTHLTKMLATEYAPYKIRVNSIAPGLYPSEATHEIMGVTSEGTRKPGSLPIEINPALRSGSDEDMAGAILYLTSRAGAFLNGIVLLTDGGALSVHPGTY